MLWSFLYQASCRSFQLLALRLRSSERNELEILVLRHPTRDREAAGRMGLGTVGAAVAAGGVGSASRRV